MRRVIAVLLALVIATGAGLYLYAASQRSFATREQFERQRRAVFERHGFRPGRDSLLWTTPRSRRIFWSWGMGRRWS